MPLELRVGTTSSSGVGGYGGNSCVCVCDSTKTQTEVVNPSHSTIEHNIVLWTFSLIVSYQTHH